MKLGAAPITRLVRSAAASDPDMAALLRAANDTREDRARHHARLLKQRGYLREGVTVAQATDVSWTCTSDELYDLLVAQRGWSLPRYARFLADFMTAALLPQPAERYQAPDRQAAPGATDYRPGAQPAASQQPALARMSVGTCLPSAQARDLSRGRGGRTGGYTPAILVERRMEMCLPAATLWHQQLGAPRGAVYSCGDGRAPPPGRRSGLVKLEAA